MDERVKDLLYYDGTVTAQTKHYTISHMTDLHYEMGEVYIGRAIATLSVVDSVAVVFAIVYTIVTR